MNEKETQLLDELFGKDVRLKEQKNQDAKDGVANQAKELSRKKEYLKNHDIVISGLSDAESHTKYIQLFIDNKTADEKRDYTNQCACNMNVLRIIFEFGKASAYPK